MSAWGARLQAWAAAHQRLIRWIVAAVALALVVRILVDHHEDLRCLARLRVWQIGLLWALYGAYLLLRAARLLIITRAMSGLAIGFWTWFRIFAISRFANLLFPQAGDIYRAGVLKLRHGLPLREYVAAYAFFAWTDTVINLLLAVIVVAALKPGLSIGGVNAAAATGLLLGLAAVGPVLAAVVWKAGRPRRPVLVKAHEYLTDLLAMMARAGTDRALVTKLLVVGMTLFALAVGLFEVAFAGLGVSIDLADLVLFVAIYKLSTLVAITPGNIGVRELAYAVLAQLIGVGMAKGVLVSVVLYAAQYTLYIPLGLVLGLTRAPETPNRVTTPPADDPQSPP